jgi:signal transduction histidine kinase
MGIFHVFAELFPALVGIIMFIVVIKTYKFTNNNFLLYYGLGYFWIAILDVAHMLVFPTMSLFPYTGMNPTLNIWVLTRLFEAIIIITAPIFLVKKAPIKIFTTLFGIISILIYIFSISDFRLTLFTEQEGLTALKITLEYVVIVLLSISIYMYKKIRISIGEKTYNFIILSLLFTIIAELLFTLYTDEMGFTIFLGHVFKFFSFWMIYSAIVKISLDEPFSALAQEANTFDSIPIPSMVVSKDGLLQQINNATKSCLHLKAKDILNHSNHELFHKKDTLQKDCEICQAIHSQKTLDNYKLKVDNYTTLLFSVNPIKKGFEEAGMIQTIEDISEKEKAKYELEELNKNLEKLVEEKTNTLKITQQKLMESEKMSSLTKLVTGVAHEINTPIGIILTGVSHLTGISKDIQHKYDKNELSENEFKQYLDNVENITNATVAGIENLKNLIDSFKKLSTDLYIEEKREFILYNYINGLVNTLISQLNISIEISIDKNLKIISYPDLFAQIINILVKNSAIHAFSNKESINNKVFIEIINENNFLFINYSDNGKGIKKDILPKIFDPFFTTNRVGGGSGLGLHILYNIVKEKFNGDIICESEVNNGTAFKITVPL